MTSLQSTTARIEHHAETSASAQAIWKLWANVSGWVHWNPGVKAIVLHGPFAAGTRFQMTLPDGDVIESVLSDVRPNERFVDETQVGELVVRVTHSIATTSPARRRVVYALEATGPGAAEIGPAIAADFLEVLKNLIELAERAG